MQKLDENAPVDIGTLLACSSAVQADPSPENMFNFGMLQHAMERYEQALDMFEGAARQDSADAQYMLGIMHLNG